VFVARRAAAIIAVDPATSIEPTEASETFRAVRALQQCGQARDDGIGDADVTHFRSGK
jgi:hypothetical protein